MLEENRNEIDQFNKGAVTSFDLDAYDVVIEGLPQKRILDSEILAIKDFIFKGGGLLLIGGSLSAIKYPIPQWMGFQFLPRLGGVPLWKGFTQNTCRKFRQSKISSIIQNLNRLSTTFSIRFGTTIIHCGRNSFRDRFTPIVTKFFHSPIVKNISQLIVADASRIFPLQNNENIQVIGVTDADTLPPKCKVVVSAQFGKGRVVAVGSPSFFLLPSKRYKYGMYQPTHLIFIMNVMNWLVNENDRSYA